MRCLYRVTNTCAAFFGFRIESGTRFMNLQLEYLLSFCEASWKRKGCDWVGVKRGRIWWSWRTRKYIFFIWKWEGCVVDKNIQVGFATFVDYSFSSFYYQIQIYGLWIKLFDFIFLMNFFGFLVNFFEHKIEFKLFLWFFFFLTKFFCSCLNDEMMGFLYIYIESDDAFVRKWFLNNFY